MPGVFQGHPSETSPHAINRPDQQPPVRRDLPVVVLDHLNAMSDDTGVLQHAIHSVPDRTHGYCVDDNARALLLASSLVKLNLHGNARISEGRTSSYAAFVQHAYNADTGRFRNFMSFERQWLEEQGSEDSHGRTLWALGVAARDDATETRRAWAKALFLLRLCRRWKGSARRGPGRLR